LANRAGWASVYRVTRTDDHAPDGCQPSDCTLREAILAANAGSSGPLYKAVITFGVNGTFTLTRAGNDDTASTGDLDITGGSLLLLGNGADQTVIDAGGLDRVFHILNGAIVVLQGVTLQNGTAAGDPGFTVGGADLNDGCPRTWHASGVQSNQATSGGGLSNFNNALTTVNGSAIVNNAAADGSGGGLGVFTGSSVTVNNTTIGGNTADRGGGAYVSDLGSTLSLNFSTLARNTAATGTGGGVRWISDGAWSARNSLVAGNTGTDCAATASAGAFTSQGFNLFGQNGGANGCLVGGTDKALAGAIGTALSASLAAARAGVPAYALVPGGPAVDAIALGANCALPSFDVADQPRPADGDHNGTLACDLGALELRTGVPGTGGLSLFLPLIVR
ncbi:MAG: hypothetical protein JNK29_16310, partial [Anaerolineales bacterium]|nr:hypothetical protein [Anaerolineales bacterium]